MSDLDPLPGYGARPMIQSACALASRGHGVVPWERVASPNIRLRFDLMGSHLAASNQVMIDNFIGMIGPANLEQRELLLACTAVREELGIAPVLPAGTGQDRNIPVDECARAAQLNEPKG